MLLAEEIANEKAEKEIRGQAQQQVTVLLDLLIHWTGPCSHNKFGSTVVRLFTTIVTINHLVHILLCCYCDLYS